MSENVTQSVIPARQRVAEEIRVLLARRRISGSELARRVGVTQPYMSRRLMGEIAIDVDDLERIAEVLGVTSADLLAGLPTRGSDKVNRRRDRHHGPGLSALAVRIPGPSAQPQAIRPPNYPSAARRPRILDRRAA